MTKAVMGFSMTKLHFHNSVLLHPTKLGIEANSLQNTSKKEKKKRGSAWMMNALPDWPLMAMGIPGPINQSRKLSMSNDREHNNNNSATLIPLVKRHHCHEAMKEEEGEKKQFQLTMMQRRRVGLISVSAMVVAASTMVETRRPFVPPKAQAAEISWGTRSFIKEKYFQPGLSPKEAVARIRQTTEGLREMRHMLDTMSWRYVMFYIRLKSAYLDSDLKNALATLPEPQHKSYIKTANEVVDYMSELDRYVRSPKVYESYLYYEKALKSLDELVAMLA